MTDNEMLEQLRRFAVEDPNDEEAMRNLRDALDGAEAYLAAGGVTIAADRTDLQALALRKLALYYYECRAPDPRYGFPDLPPDLNALVLQLRTAPDGEGSGEQEAGSRD